MSKETDLVKLVALSDAAFAAASADLAVNLRKDAALVQQIDDLRMQHRNAAAITDQPASRAGADLAWQAWVEKRIVLINAARARLRAEQEGLRANVARMHGRTRVITKLAENERLAKRRKLTRDAI